MITRLIILFLVFCIVLFFSPATAHYHQEPGRNRKGTKANPKIAEILDSTDAKYLVELVVNEKFRSHIGISDEIGQLKQTCTIRSYPNPCNDKITAVYQVDRKSVVSVELVSATGKSIFSRQEGMKEKGAYTFEIPVRQLQPGLYLLLLQAGESFSANKMVIMK